VTSASVVIATHNRGALVGRAIESALAQPGSVEVVVVDDASADDTADRVAGYGDRVRYLRQDENLGPGAARNRGIREAHGELLILLDDDDELLPDAVAQVVAADRELDDGGRHPVLQFRTTSTLWGVEAFLEFDFDAYTTGFRGDLAPVVRRRRFLELGLGYPTIRPAAEHILWLRVAAEHGIPAWPIEIIRVNADAPTRLTAAPTPATARLYALMQEETLAQLADVATPHYLRRRRVAAAAYWLIAGEPRLARRHLTGRAMAGAPARLPLLLLSYAPHSSASGAVRASRAALLRGQRIGGAARRLVGARPHTGPSAPS
jgi:GalNAc5-diNAcBac-PP-undecaprenol beta-1,3-glucosyltransferase